MIPRTERLFRLGLHGMPALLFAAVFVIFGIFSPRFVEYQSLENIVKQASYVGILSVGMTFVLLTGGIDLSIGSNMYLSGVTAGLLIQRYDLPAWAALAACLIVGTLFGMVNAVLITRLRIIPFVATLATWALGKGLGQMLTQSQEVVFSAGVTGLGSQEILGLPCPIWIFAAVTAAAWTFLHRTPMGRQIYAVGFDREIARRAGIRTDRALAISYVACGTLAALGGFVSVAQLGNINAGFGDKAEFEAIAAAVLGGVSLFGGIGSVFPGTVLGVVMIKMINTGLVSAQVDPYLQPLASAGILFAAVLLDSIRKGQLVRMNRRTIRVEEEGN